MKYYDTELVVMVDCDDTLVLWIDPTIPGDDKLVVVDPYDKSIVHLTPHDRHIKLVRDYHERGYLVIIWSAAGAKWAHTVAAVTGLLDYVDIIMSKPIKYIDDLPAAEVLGSRVYLEHKPL